MPPEPPKRKISLLPLVKNQERKIEEQKTELENAAAAITEKEALIAERDRRVKELEEEIEKARKEREAAQKLTPQSERTKQERQTASAAAIERTRLTEAETRALIDEQLRRVGWEADTENLRYAKGTRPQKGRKIAIAEWPVDSGKDASAAFKNARADYALFAGEKLIGIIEAKAYAKSVYAIIDNQCHEYARSIKSEDEKYDKYVQSEVTGTIYEHCVKAIEKALDFGENGLPKIGSGDWNDGFSEVGNKGKGESVWLGFFLYLVLERFIPICVEKQDLIRAEKYEKIKQELKKSLNTNGWDGRWYKRAYMDNGNALGSMENEECRIDGISQSWSVISGAGDNDKKYICMQSLENHLIDKETRIIKLLDPPFEKSIIEPGYIKAYMPGVRENGGQYTHAAVWVVIAESMLGFGDKAFELFKIINPIEHARTKDAANKYKVEPYVISADIYGSDNLAGRGGWTWYTGSSSWYYKAGIEYILGLKIKKGILKIEPCIPKDWKEYAIRYKWQNSVYNINVRNENGKNIGVEKIFLDGKQVKNEIILDGNGKVFNIEVQM